jgi:hypothetical protein
MRECVLASEEHPKPRPDLEKLALLAGIASAVLSALTAIAKGLAWLWGVL